MCPVNTIKGVPAIQTFTMIISDSTLQIIWPDSVFNTKYTYSASDNSIHFQFKSYPMDYVISSEDADDLTFNYKGHTAVILRKNE